MGALWDTWAPWAPPDIRGSVPPLATQDNMLGQIVPYSTYLLLLVMGGPSSNPARAPDQRDIGAPPATFNGYRDYYCQAKL